MNIANIDPVRFGLPSNFSALMQEARRRIAVEFPMAEFATQGDGMRVYVSLLLRGQRESWLIAAPGTPPLFREAIAPVPRIVDHVLQEMRAMRSDRSPEHDRGVRLGCVAMTSREAREYLAREVRGAEFAMRKGALYATVVGPGGPKSWLITQDNRRIFPRQLQRITDEMRHHSDPALLPPPAA